MCDVYGDERADIWANGTRSARKRHTCDSCAGSIEKGQRYYTVTAFYEGSWASAKMCALCNIFYEAFGKEHRFFPWPESFREYLSECVREEGDEANSRWTPMLEAMDARRAEASHAS